jgi:threonine synthase
MTSGPTGGEIASLECPRCGKTRPFGPPPATLCPCGSPLLARYRLDHLRARPGEPGAPGHAGPLFAGLGARPPTLWRYAELLPDVPQVSLGEGFTPLLPAPRLGAELGLERLFVKDEAVNPTGSFKARGMAVAISVAAAHGVRVVAAPSAGNAGSALAAYGARAGMNVRLFLPDSTPAPFLAEARRLGADVTLVPGSIADCGRRMREKLGPADRRGWFDMSTLREPFRVEGKKTMGFELFEQLGGRLPDVILYPTGGGTGLIGMWKSFAEMQALGWIGEKRPRMISVQAAGCAPIVRAFRDGRATADPWEDPRTRASGLRVPGTLGDFLILEALRKSGGEAIAVEEEALSAGARRMAALEGVDACPEGGACLAALRVLKEGGRVLAGETVVLFNTGTGLKYDA